MQYLKEYIQSTIIITTLQLSKQPFNLSDQTFNLSGKRGASLHFKTPQQDVLNYTHIFRNHQKMQ